MHFKLLIIGGGTGGITMAARMLKHIPQGLVGIIEPSETHYYQPFWTLVGAGIGNKEMTAKPMSQIIPEGCQWIKNSVKQIHPNENTVELAQGKKITYDYLIVATGLKLDFHKIKGLENNLGKNGIHTIYDYEGCEKTFNALNSMKNGTAIFYMPPTPIKCAGAPQKIMYLADEVFKNNGVRENIKMIWTSCGAAMFGVADFVPGLNAVVQRKKIETKFTHKLIEIDAQNKIAKYEHTENGHITYVELKYDFIHVVPQQSAHEFITHSGLAHTEGAQMGWLKVHENTLQHLDYPNVFGIGDVTGLANSKTGAAIRNQAPLLEQNILQVMNGEKPTHQYHGYSSCPLITSFSTVILAEFGYNGKLMPTFPIDPRKERWIYWILKRYLLPKIYWWGMLKGKL